MNEGPLEIEIEHLFLYGTLLPELATGSLAATVAQLTFVGPGGLPGRLYDLGAYPGLVADGRAGEVVYGDLFRLPGAAGFLAELDAYEGFIADNPTDSLYVRSTRTVTLLGGESIRAWVYEYNRDVSRATAIPGGDYRVWLKRTRR